MDEALTQLIRDAMPLAAELGFEGIEGGPEAVVLRGIWAPERCTAAGVLHGGYLMSLADTAAATLASSTCPRAQHGHDRGEDELPRGRALRLRDGACRGRSRGSEDDRRPGGRD